MGTAEDVAAASPAPGRSSAAGPTTPVEGAGRGPAPLPRPRPRPPGRAARPHPGRERQGPRVGVRGDHGPGGHRPLLRPPRSPGPTPPAPAAPRCPAWCDPGAPRPQGRRRRDLAVELPAGAGRSSDALAALVAGNGVVIKPDSQTPFTAIRAFELLEEAGLPRGPGRRSSPGPGRRSAPPSSSRTDYMMFTGSTATGRTVAGQAGERLIGCLGRARRQERHGRSRPTSTSTGPCEGAVVGCFANTGQLCISIERIYVDQPDRRASSPPLRRAGAGPPARRRAGLRPRGRRARLPGPARQGERPTSTTPSPRAPRVVAGGQARPDIGPVLLRAHRARRRHPGDGRATARRRSARSWSIYPWRRVDEAVDAGQRHRVRPQRQRLHAATPTGAAASRERLHGRHRQRQRRLPVGLGQPRRPDGRDEGLGRRSPARPGGPAQVHRAADRRRAVRAGREAPDPGTDGEGYAKRFTSMLRWCEAPPPLAARSTSRVSCICP